MSKIVTVTAPSIHYACTAARKRLGLALNSSREVLRSGGEDSLYRVHLSDGTIIEATIVQHKAVEIHGVVEA